MRPISLFTGQWADLALRDLLPAIKKMGYDAVELACWGDHFEVQKALNDSSYIQNLWALLEENNLQCYAISNHLVGQAICDKVDERHQAILPDYVWGDGKSEGVQKRAAQEMIATAQVARQFFEKAPYSVSRKVVNSFSGSCIWSALYSFPPASQEFIQRGFDDFAHRFLPVLEKFEEEDVFFALEVHPTEIAFDIATAHRALKVLDFHSHFGFNYDPSHLAYQGVDYLSFLRNFGERIFNVHMKDVWWGKGDGSVGVFGGHTEFGDFRRFWDFRSLGRGNIDWQAVIATLNDINYEGPLSVEWEDTYMDRFHGAEESCQFVKDLDFPRSQSAFDSAFEKK